MWQAPNFLKLKEPKLQNLLDLGYEHDLAETVKKNIFSDVNKVYDYHKQQNSNWQPSWMWKIPVETKMEIIKVVAKI